MLARPNRLRRAGDFRRIYAQGRTVAGRHLVLKYRLGGTGVPRIGIVVGTKVSKHAIERNRIRRRLREIVRANQSLLPGSLDLVIVARPQANRLDFDALKSETLLLLRQTSTRLHRPSISPS